ncbi:Palmitoyl-protein thioesterase 1 [Gurleya vavrai]
MTMIILLELKEKGNEYFKKNLYDDALHQYLIAVEKGIVLYKKILLASDDFMYSNDTNFTNNKRNLYNDTLKTKEKKLEEDKIIIEIDSNTNFESDIKNQKENLNFDTMGKNYHSIELDKKKYDLCKNEKIETEIINCEKIEAGVKNLASALNQEFINRSNYDNKIYEIKLFLSKLYFNIASTYYKQFKYQLCIESCTKSLNYFDLQQAKIKKCLSYFKTGNLYYAKKYIKQYNIKDKETTNILSRAKENDIATFFYTFNYEKEFYDDDLQEFIINDAFFLKILSSFFNYEKVEAKYLFAILKIGYDLLSNLDNVSFIDTKKEVYVFGDTHGQFFDTFGALIAIEGNFFDFKNGFKLNTNKIFIFNGDFVDRGSYSIENFIFLLILKILYPENMFLNRGNHEFVLVNLQFGFSEEITKKYQFMSKDLLHAFSLTFSMLPLATIINRKVFVVHGGLPKNNFSINNILLLDRKTEICEGELFYGLMWSDPGEILDYEPNQRGVGILWGKNITESFLQENNLKCIVRSHEFLTNGYKHNHDNKVITIFSSPNYCKMQSKAAYLIFKEKNGLFSVCDNLTYDIVQFDEFQEKNLSDLKEKNIL